MLGLDNVLWQRLGQLNTLFIILCCSSSTSVSTGCVSSLFPATWSVLATTLLDGADVASSCVPAAPTPTCFFNICFLFFSTCSFVDCFVLLSLTVFWSFSIISLILRTCFLLYPGCFFLSCLLSFICLITRLASTGLSVTIKSFNFSCSKALFTIQGLLIFLGSSNLARSGWLR